MVDNRFCCKICSEGSKYFSKYGPEVHIQRVEILCDRSIVCTDSPSVAVLQCKMRGLFVVVVLIATLVSQGTAQLPCKLRLLSP